MDAFERVDRNPYAPPRAKVGTGGVSRQRHHWVAVALAPLSPVFSML